MNIKFYYHYSNEYDIWRDAFSSNFTNTVIVTAFKRLIINLSLKSSADSMGVLGSRDCVGSFRKMFGQCRLPK